MALGAAGEVTESGLSVTVPNEPSSPRSGPCFLFCSALLSSSTPSAVENESVRHLLDAAVGSLSRSHSRIGPRCDLYDSEICDPTPMLRMETERNIERLYMVRYGTACVRAWVAD